MSFVDRPRWSLSVVAVGRSSGTRLLGFLIQEVPSNLTGEISYALEGKCEKVPMWCSRCHVAHIRARACTDCDALHPKSLITGAEGVCSLVPCHLNRVMDRNYKLLSLK